jgi:hypothetical protein
VEDHPDHHEEINAPYEKVCTSLDILTFLTLVMAASVV